MPNNPENTLKSSAESEKDKQELLKSLDETTDFRDEQKRCFREIIEKYNFYKKAHGRIVSKEALYTESLISKNHSENPKVNFFLDQGLSEQINSSLMESLNKENDSLKNQSLQEPGKNSYSYADPLKENDGAKLEIIEQSKPQLKSTFFPDQIEESDEDDAVPMNFEELSKQFMKFKKQLKENSKMKVKIQNQVLNEAELKVLKDQAIANIEASAMEEVVRKAISQVEEKALGVVIKQSNQNIYKLHEAEAIIIRERNIKEYKDLAMDNLYFHVLSETTQRGIEYLENLTKEESLKEIKKNITKNLQSEFKTSLESETGKLKKDIKLMKAEIDSLRKSLRSLFMRQNIEFLVRAYFNIPQKFMVSNISKCFEHMIEEICLNVENINKNIFFFEFKNANDPVRDPTSEINCEIYRKIKFSSDSEKEYHANLDVLKDFVYNLVKDTDPLEMFSFGKLNSKWLKTTLLYKKCSEEIHKFIIHSREEFGEQKTADEECLFIHLTNFYEPKKDIIEEELVNKVKNQTFPSNAETANFTILG